jgi:hypothetical protein
LLGQGFVQRDNDFFHAFFQKVLFQPDGQSGPFATAGDAVRARLGLLEDIGTTESARAV